MEAVVITFLDFFSGIGGFRKGFELCGMVCKGHCEIDKYADRSYRAIFEVKEDEWYRDDITKVQPRELPRVNLWCGGFPCQDISISGQQRGLEGERSSLFFEIVRLLKGTPAENRPEWLVLENVKNLLSIHQGWDFTAILCALAEVGYHIEYGLLNSRFHSVPQNRERIYLVAYRHFGAGSGRKVFPVQCSNSKALIELIGGKQGRRVYDTQGIGCTLLATGGGHGGKTGLYFVDLSRGTPRLTDAARCPKANYDGGVSNQRSESSGVFFGCGCHAVLTPEQERKRQDFKDCGEPAFTVNAADRHGVQLVPCVACPQQTIVTYGVQQGCGRIRRLTPRECWRLQGFPDEMFDIASTVNSDTQLYKQAGNSVTISVVYAVGQRITAIQNELDREKERRHEGSYPNAKE